MIKKVSGRKHREDEKQILVLVLTQFIVSLMVVASAMLIIKKQVLIHSFHASI